MTKPRISSLVRSSRHFTGGTVGEGMAICGRDNRGSLRFGTPGPAGYNRGMTFSRIALWLVGTALILAVALHFTAQFQAPWPFGILLSAMLLGMASLVRFVHRWMRRNDPVRSGLE